MSEITVRAVDIYAPVGAGGSIVVGAGEGIVDVAKLVAGFTLEGSANTIPELTLRLTLTAKVRAGAHVQVDAETAALLVELGWTAPVLAAPG